MLTGLAQSDVGDCQISWACSFWYWQCCESTDNDGKHSSGVRRNSSLDGHVRFITHSSFLLACELKEKTFVSYQILHHRHSNKGDKPSFSTERLLL